MTDAGAGGGKGPVPALRELRDAIPKECFQPDTRESLKYAAVDLGPVSYTHLTLPTILLV